MLLTVTSLFTVECQSSISVSGVRFSVLRACWEFLWVFFLLLLRWRPGVLTVYVGVVECAPASLPLASSSLTHARSGWFLQLKRRPVRLPRRTILSNCICRCSRMRACLSSPRVLLPHTCTQDGCGCRASAGRLRPGNGDQPEALYALALIH
jgi:hypothetical protein